MKFYKFCIALLLCVVLTVHPIGSEIHMDGETEANTFNALFPAFSGLIGMCVTAIPMGPILVGTLGLIHTATMVITGISNSEDDVGKALCNLDILKSQTVITNEIANMKTDFKRDLQQFKDRLENFINKILLDTKLREDVSTLQRKYSDKKKVFMNPNVTGVQKNVTMSGLLNLDSPFLALLRGLVENYIKPSDDSLILTGPTKSYYELMLEKDKLLAADNEDTYTDSLHSKMFKAYMIIAKVLTECYSLPLIAHTIQYQQEIKQNLMSDGDATKSNAEDLIKDYKKDMKTVVERTKWALDRASRVVRNPGSFELVKGKTFEHTSFCQTIPRIMALSQNGCWEEEAILNLKDFETGNCNTYGDIIPTNSKLSIFHDPNNLERPYQYMKVITPDGTEDIYGHENSDSNLIEHQATISDQCPTVFCPAFKKNAFGISTQRIRADYGNAITGLRFRVENNILYIDIQQGKVIDMITVEPNVYWTKTPAGGPVTYLSSHLNKLELGDFEAEAHGEFLKSIHLRPGNARSGTINVFTDYSKGPNWYASSPIGSTSNIPESNEIRVPDADDLEKAGDSVKSKMSPPPKNGERSYISLQPTNIKKDMGRTCYPLIDTREVLSATPLCGFGIYHDTLGVIGLKGITCKLDHLADYELIEKFTEAVKVA